MPGPDPTPDPPSTARHEAAEAVRGGHLILGVALALVSIAEDVHAIRRNLDDRARRGARG